MDTNLIIVPTDFSKVAHTALNHAVKVAQTTQSKISLVHIVPKSDMLTEAKEKLRIAKEMALNELKFEVDTIARVGSIYEDIADLALELDANLIVMGTHGLRGLQFITGSRALRIVTSADVPFLIVQEKEVGENGYDDIVVPLDLHKETKQKLRIVANTAKYFKSRVHLIVPGETDEFLRNQVERNLKYAQNYFSDKNIPCTAKISKLKSDDFDDAILEYAQEIDADLISIMNIAGSSLSNLIGGNYVQNIITNKAEIPVLVLNPKETTTSSIFGAYTGAG
jgi:nucleotide-binding universal stress UspA family protein